MYAIFSYETLVVDGTQTFCCFELFRGDVLKNQFVYCLTSCRHHLVKHVCTRHASVKFERIRIRFLLTSFAGSHKLLSVSWI